jgi:ADP-heptose:LPS heptosyltransferase
VNKIELIKRLDAVVGIPLCSLFPRAGGNDGGIAVHRILLIRPGGIGDAVLLAPTIEALKKKFPQAKLTVLAEKRNAGIFALIPGVDRVLRYDVAREFLAVFRLEPDIILDTEQYHRLSAVVARLIGAGILIGFGSNQRARLFHHAISYSHDTYEAISFLQLLGPLGIGCSDLPDTPFLQIPAAAQSQAAKLLASRGGCPIVTIFPGASIPERRWGAERFARVAASIAALGYTIVVVGGKEDRASAPEIIAGIKGLNFTGQTTLAETAAILQHSALLISADSGILHMGVGLGTPTISLFGPGIAEKWGPRGPLHRILDGHLPCSPCTRFGSTQRCPRNAECMGMISADEVVQAAMMMLKKAEAPPYDQ